MYTMVKQQCGYLNVCVYYSTSMGYPMITIIFRGTPHLIYLGPEYTSTYILHTYMYIFHIHVYTHMCEHHTCTFL
jgi:hypothetical protein